MSVSLFDALFSLLTNVGFSSINNNSNKGVKWRMYTKDSLIVDIVEALNETDLNTKTLSKQLKLRNGLLSEVLKFAGFRFEGKKWAFKYGNKSNLDLTFNELQEQLSNITSNADNKDNNNSNSVSDNASNINNKSNEHNNVLPFTPAEIDALKELAQLHLNKPIYQLQSDIAATNLDKLTGLLERIDALESVEHDRKTFVIEKALIKRFDTFTNKHRLKKSDLMTLALTDLLNRYE